MSKRWHPKYGLLWLVLSFFWLLSRFNSVKQVKMGRVLGRILHACVPKIKYVSSCNISACFPELGPKERACAVKLSCEELGISILETFYLWFQGPKRTLLDRVTVEGLEYFESAIAGDRGVILIACHYGSVDVNGAILSSLDRGERLFYGTYKDTDGVVNGFLRRVRGKFMDDMFSASDQRSVVRALKKKHLVWYAPDIEVRGKNSAMVDFMGVPASTTVAISRLAKSTNAVVLPFVHYRNQEDMAYQARFLPAIDAIPSGDPVADTGLINKAMEEMISPEPFRYWWAIKRFKRRPEGMASIY